MSAPARMPVVLHASAEATALTRTATVLAGEGFRVIEARDGATALELAREVCPEVIVLDVLHDVARSDLTRRLRGDEATSGAPVVHVGPGGEDFAVGADGYLRPGYDAQELLVLIRSLARLRQAERAVREQDELIATLGHELRNPLSAVRSGLALLERAAGDHANAARVRGIIERQSEHLGRLIEDMLDVARLTHGKLDFKPAPLDLRDVVAASAEAARASFDRMGVTMSVVTSDAPVVVVGDPMRLEQIVANLLDNALKYTPRGGAVEVVVGIAPGEPAHAFLRIKDNGAGIERSHLEQLFRLFYQGDTSRSRRAGGLGIGLTVVQRLVALHGGAVRVASAGPGCGTELTIELPCGASRLPVAPSRSAASSAPSPADAATARRVLLVDDNADSRELLEEILRGEGHIVKDASDGEQALRRLLAERFDVAIVDIGLPDFDGYAVVRAAREALGRDTPFLIALTGFASPADREAAKRAGFDVHLVKPVDTALLTATVARTARTCD